MPPSYEPGMTCPCRWTAPPRREPHDAWSMRRTRCDARKGWGAACRADPWQPRGAGLRRRHGGARGTARATGSGSLPARTGAGTSRRPFWRSGSRRHAPAPCNAPAYRGRRGIGRGLRAGVVPMARRCGGKPSQARSGSRLRSVDPTFRGPRIRSVQEGIGAGRRSRTADLRITNALLYQLSYTGWVRTPRVQGKASSRRRNEAPNYNPNERRSPSRPGGRRVTTRRAWRAA